MWLPYPRMVWCIKDAQSEYSQETQYVNTKQWDGEQINVDDDQGYRLGQVYFVSILLSS